MTACFGGVIRDILCAEIPVILGKKYILSVSLEALSFILKKFNLEDSFFIYNNYFGHYINSFNGCQIKWYLPTSKTNKKKVYSSGLN
jgi:uncharacterized membrane protein YeiH